MKNGDIILQTTVFSKCQNKQGLYYHITGTGKVSENALKLEKGAILSTLTYMSCFDSWAWNRYTGIKNWKLAVTVQGALNLSLYRWDGNEKLLVSEKQTATKREMLIANFPQPEDGSLIFFEIVALEDATIYEAEYRAEVDDGNINPVHLSVLICTYKRNLELQRSIETLENSKFFHEASSYYGGMSLRIVDNASELPVIDRKFIKLYHNPNTGGSGGFTRGIMETRKEEAEYGITHAVFMDDDTVVEAECFYRLYALLGLVKPCYQEEVIAGRMFDLNKEYIQYTASEIWNKGDIKHVGFKRDMRKREELLEMNREQGEYAGWWFACYPMSFVREEIPLPFFIHCDDVEYGLRHGGAPMILNGIQVWHETYEKRQSPLISYYDTRNKMIVNTMYHYYHNERELLEKWYIELVYALRAKKYCAIFPSLMALKDYLKGREYFMNQTMKKENVTLNLPLSTVVTLIQAVIQYPIFRVRIKKAFQTYKEINRE